MATLQPWAANCLADARPMPWLPPVTRANFPERPKSMSRSSLERPAEAAFVAEEILAVEVGRFQPEHILDSMHDRLGVRIELVLEFAHRRTRRVGKADALDRRLQPAEAFLVDARRQLGAEAAVDPVAVGDDAAAGPLDRFDDQILVERRQGARIDDLDRDPALVQDVCRQAGLDIHP